MIEDIYKLSPLQEGLYYHWLTNPNSQDYFVQLAFKIHGTLNVDVVEESYKALVQRHPLLRTFFSSDYGSTLLQIVKVDIESEFCMIDACDEDTSTEFKISDRLKGFDLNRGSQMRLSVLKFKDGTYEFVWSHHHIIMDGWCLSILMKDFFNIYSQKLLGLDPSLSKISPFSTYIKWLESRDEAGSLNYWKENLSYLEQPTSIPIKRNTPEAFVNESKHIDYKFTSVLSHKIRNYCKENSITENTFFQTVWAIHLSKFNFTEDIVFGTVVSGRPGELHGIEEMVGLFSNTVPVPVKVKKSLSVQTLAKLTQTKYIGSIDHHHVQLADILSTTEFGNHLFDHILVFENYPIQELVSVDNKNANSPLDISITSTQAFDQIGFDFWVTISSRQDFTIDFGFNTFLYDQNDVSYFLERYVDLINDLLNHPKKNIGELKNINDEESFSLLKRASGKVNHYGVETVLELFEQQVKIKPEGIAVRFNEMNYTYRMIDELSSKMASNLISIKNIQKGDVIAVKVPRDERLIICYLGIIKIGAVFLPLDPTGSNERNNFILTDSKSICCVNLELYDSLMVKDVGNQLSRENFKISGSDPMYILYTSGSTGLPKGCSLNHEGIVNRLMRMWKYLQGRESDSILNKTNCAFDVSIWEIFLPVCFGGSLVFADGDISDPKNLINHIEKYSVSIIHFVPSMLNEFLEYLYYNPENLIKIESLIHVISSGEELKPDLVNKWYQITDIPIHNLYGPTEASIDVTYFKTSPNISCVPIGRPIDNMRVYILNHENNVQPIGAIGEICIGGIGLSSGYINRDDLTSERFVPVLALGNSIVYRTGDLGRWLSDGNIEFLGRIDNQVKIRGYRIELGEIEKILLAFAGITSSVVLAHRFGTDDLELCAYYVSNREILSEEIRSFLLSMLPTYMVPTRFISVDFIPTTANGKIDRGELIKIAEKSNANSFVNTLPPEGDIEISLAEVWSEILGIESNNIHRYSTFFELGGHSLRVVKLMLKISKRFGVHLGLKELFDHSSLKEQATCISGYSIDKINTIMPAEPLPSYGISPGQKNLWVLSQSKDASAAYNIYGSYEFEADTNKAVFDSIFRYLIQRHEILRTCFAEDVDGIIRQFIIQDADIDFKVEVIEIESELLLEKIISEKISIPFDLGKGPLVKVYLFNLPNSRMKLTFVLHHIVCDEWSLKILESEFQALMKLSLSNEQLILPEVKFQFKDYSEWILNNLNQDNIYQQQAYWIKKLEGNLSRTEFPLDKPRGLRQSFGGNSLKGNIEKSILEKLNSIARENNCSLYVVILTAIKTLLYRYTSETDIMVGSSAADRMFEELDGTVGYFVNTVPLRTLLKKSDTFLTLLEKVRNTVTEALENQNCPFEEIIDHVNIDKDHNQYSLFNIMIVYQPKDDQINSLDHPPLTKGNSFEEPMFNANVKSKFDLTFFIKDMDSELFINLTYNSDLYEDLSIRRLFKSLNLILNAIVRFTNCSINQLPIIPKDDLSFITKTLAKSTFVQRADTSSILQLFKRKVLDAPNNIAVSSKGRNLSYFELDKLSDRLAKFLIRDYEIKKGDLIGLLLDRDVDYVTAIIGILKAGGCYLPVDPEFPQDRIKIIIQDSKIDHIITHSEYLFSLDYFSGSLFAMDIQLNTEDLALEKELNFTTAKEDCAYVIYTSGSTGKPKGVCVSHGALLDYISGIQSSTNIVHACTFGLVSSFATDLGNTTLFSSLCFGGQLFIFSPEESLNNKLISSYNLDCIKIVPTHWKILNVNGKILIPNVALIFGGETLGKDVIDLLRNSDTDCTVYNHYGPTETTIGKLIHKIDFKKQNKLIPIGRPFGNNEIYVLDSDENFTPIGGIGEIHIGGDGLALGYLNDDSLTGEKFVKSKWNSELVLYKTGDYGRWLNNGDLYFEGRRDSQVKIRGNRVELSELVHALEKIEHINQAVVLSIKDENDQIDIIAFLKLKLTISKETVFEHLENCLPYFMIPRQIIFLDEIPLLANGKVDVSTLKKLNNNFLENSISVEPLTTDTEIELSKIWSKVLDVNIKNIGKKEHFFNLGGHSLKVAQLVNEVNKTFQKTIEFYEIFDTPVLELQGRLIDASVDKKYNTIQRALKKDGYKLSSSQKRLWIVCQDSSVNIAYNIPKFIEFEDLDVKRLEKAIAEVINRHEILRTIFKEDHKQEVSQIILDDVTISSVVSKVDLRNNEDPAFEAKLRYKEDCRYLFNFEEFPLLKIKIYRISERKYAISFIIHHIVSDAWSAQNIMREFLSIYHANDNQVELSDLPIQYKDFSEWQNDQLISGNFENQKRFWIDNFIGLSEGTIFPNRDANNHSVTNKGNRKDYVLNRDNIEKLKSLLLENNLSMFIALLSLMSILLKKYCNSDVVTFGVPFSGRTKEELHNLIGLFVNLIPVKVDHREDDNFESLLKRVKDFFSLALKNQEYPYNFLLEDLNNLGDTRTSLFNIVITYSNYKTDLMLINEDNKIINHSSSEYLSPHQEIGISKYDISFHFIESDEDLVLRVEYNSDLYDETSILYFFNHFDVLLKSVVDNPQQKVIDIQMLTEDELSELKYISGLENPEINKSNILELYYRNFDEKKNLVAYDSGFLKYTYLQLDQISNNGAAFLQNYFKGKRGNVVAVSFPIRDERYILALLIILKSCNTYLPIDINIPKSRREYILHESACSYVIDENTFDSIIDQKLPFHAPNDIDSDDIAYILYTSGSTGNPKGVKISHQSLYKTILGHLDIFVLQMGMKMTQFFPMTFDPSLLEIFTSLCSGAELVNVEEIIKRDPNLFVEFINEKEIEITFLPPSLLKLLPVDSLKRLKILLTGGEAMDSKFVKQFCEHGAYYNSYGLTETAIASTSFKYAASSEIKHSVPIGKAINGMSVYIMDRDLNLVPKGFNGEIVISGINPKDGYLNPYNNSGFKFCKDRFRESYQMFRTGDIGKWDENNNLQIIGRLDDQVKINGFRVELTEIEFHLKNLRGIRDAKACLEKGESRSRLIAFLETNQDVDLHEIKAALKVVLPYFMIPQDYYLYQKFPVNKNGKTALEELKKLKGEKLNSPFTENKLNEIQEFLHKKWCEVLELDQIPINSSFFDIGGDSLLAVKCVGLINEDLERRMKVKDIYNYPTIELLANMIENEDYVHLESMEIDYQHVANEIGIFNFTFDIASKFEDRFENVFLTGATGFVGAYILQQILDKSNAFVYCLVRSSNLTLAKDRIIENMKFYGISKDEYESRIIPVIGDLKNKNLGISDSIYTELASKIDYIYNMGAEMDLISNFGKLSKTNVMGIFELIKFSSHKKLKKIIHGSTLSIFSNNSTTLIREDSPIHEEKHKHSIGYAGSKWMTEMILFHFKDKGIPIQIHRLGLITGDNKTGRMPKDQWFSKFLKSCYQMGEYPLGYEVPITPVDFVSNSVYELSRLTNEKEFIFHISNNHPLPIEMFFNYEDSSKKLIPLDSYDWFNSQYRKSKIEPLEISPFLDSRITNIDANDSIEINFSSSNKKISSKYTIERLNALGVFLPALDSYARKYVNNLINVNKI